MTLKWQPWIDCRPKDGDPIRQWIAGPPCGECKYWRGTLKVTANGVFDGVQFCHAPQSQERDFSCYRPREGS